MTKAFRDAQMKEKLQRYPKVPWPGAGGGLHMALHWGLPQATGRGLVYFSPGLHGRGSLMSQAAPF